MKAMDLDALRLIGVRLLAGTTALLAAITVAGAVFTGRDGGMIASALAVSLAIYPALAAWAGRIDQTARLSAAASASQLPALMLFVFQGAAWQTDLHMAFFAALAMVVILCDWRAIALGTAVVAVHHLVIGLAMPNWVFLNGGSLGRIVLHAVILLVEAGTLAWISQAVVNLIATMEEGERQRLAVRAEADAERARATEELTTVVANLEQGLTRLAAGDLTRNIDVSFPQAFVTLRSNFNDAVASLAHLIRVLAEKAEAIDGGSREIAQASEDLARRTESSAAGLQQSTAAIGEMQSRVRAGADSALATVERADRTLSVVAEGRSVATGAAQAMNGVFQSAKGIDSVIEGLDKIAFQTRVLAMNAAVEAGRAGEAGRGFAVVADLVSSLAMRAEEEARRAREQLTATQGEITVAVEMVGKVDDVLGRIVSDVNDVHALLRGMADDNQAQASTIGQISAAITAMDLATQQNAAMVEQTSAAARNLTDQVTGLTQSAERFRVAHAPSRSVGGAPARRLALAS